MRRFSINPIVAIALALAVSAAACSKGNTGSPVSPTTPSATGTAAPVTGGARISGTVVTGSASALASPFDGFATLGSAGRVTVSVNGTSITVISDDNGNFTLENVPPGTLTLTITGTGFSAQVTLPPVNSDDKVRITVRVNGNTATLDDQEVESSDNKVEVEGKITSATTTASGGTIVVGRLNTSVVVPATANITKGGTTLKPNDLVVGLRVHVRAMKSGSTLTATTVIVQTGDDSSDDKSKDDDESDDDENEVNFSGTLAAAPGGACPAITFTAGGTTVKTSASTKFDNVTCSALASGDSVKGEGVKQTDGSVLAKEVEKVNGSSGGKN